MTAGRSPSQGTPPRGPLVQFLQFVVAAGLSVPVNLGARVILSRWMPYEVALILSHVCGMVVAYGLTRLFVFAPSGRSVSDEMVRFAAVNVVSAAVTWLVAVALVRLVFPAVGFRQAPELVAHVAGLAVSAITSFVGHRRFSFGRR